MIYYIIYLPLYYGIYTAIDMVKKKALMIFIRGTVKQIKYYNSWHDNQFIIHFLDWVIIEP